MTQSFAPDMQGDYAEMDEQLFGQQDAAETAATTPTPARQGAPSQPQQPQEQQQPGLDNAAVLAELRRMQNDYNANMRIVQRAIRNGQEPDAQLLQKMQKLEDRLTDLQEQREMESLTLEEQNQRLKEQRDAARKAQNAPQQDDATTDVRIDRTEGWFIQGLADEYHEDVVPDIQAMAEDMGAVLTQEQLDNLLSYAYTAENGPAIVKQGGQYFLDWPRWLRDKVRPALRAEAKNQAEEARNRPQPRSTSPARQSPAAMGNGSRGAAGGTTPIDFFKSSNADEIAAAGWGDLR